MRTLPAAANDPIRPLLVRTITYRTAPVQTLRWADAGAGARVAAPPPPQPVAAHAQAAAAPGSISRALSIAACPTGQRM